MDSDQIDKINSKYKGAILDSHDFRGDQTITVQKNVLIELFKFLRDDPDLDFKFLMDLTAVDYLNRKDNRFEVVYHFYSLKHNHRLRVKFQSVKMTARSTQFHHYGKPLTGMNARSGTYME